MSALFSESRHLSQLANYQQGILSVHIKIMAELRSAEAGLEAKREDWISEGEVPLEEGRFIPQSVLRAMQRRARQDPNASIRRLLGGWRDLVVINDEAHHVYGEKRTRKSEDPGYIKWSKILERISKAARVSLVVDMSGWLLNNLGFTLNYGTKFQRVKRQLLTESGAGIAGGAGGKEGRNFLRALAANRRLVLLPEITAQFETLRAEIENVIDVEIVTAAEIAAPQQKRLTEALTRRLGREVRMHTRIDESLIGGAVVRAGDLVIDGSLKGRLARLNSALTN